ncbi:MAG: hypothetical protein R3C31_05120 [Hyphomonadaceae bacterium]
MTDSPFTYEFQNPGLEEVHFLLKTIVMSQDHGEVRGGLKACCKQAWPERDHSHVLMDVQDICAHAITRIQRTTAPSMMKDIHIGTIQGIRKLFLRNSDRDKWVDFQGAIVAGQYVQNVIVVDHFVGRDVMSDAQWDTFASSTEAGAEDFLTRVRESTELPGELKELVLGQLQLVRDSLKRYQKFGLSSFQETVALSYGRLSMVLQHRPDKQSWKIVEEIVCWEANLHTSSSSMAGGRGLLTFEDVKALPAPKAA